jgi:hypothetical protein
MSTKARIFSAADYLRLSELWDANNPLHVEFVGKASEAFYSQPCSNGHVDWRACTDEYCTGTHASYGEPFDQDAETVDGYANDLGWIDWRSIRIAAVLTLGVLVLFGLLS